MGALKKITEMKGDEIEDENACATGKQTQGRGRKLGEWRSQRKSLYLPSVKGRFARPVCPAQSDLQPLSCRIFYLK